MNKYLVLDAKKIRTTHVSVFIENVWRFVLQDSEGKNLDIQLSTNDYYKEDYLIGKHIYLNDDMFDEFDVVLD